MSEKRGSAVGDVDGGDVFDVVVVGGGIIGLSCAWRLAQRGARVAVVERGEPGCGATRVAAGMLAPVGELTFGEPELLELTLAAARLYPAFVAEVEATSGETTGYEQLGALHVALDRDEAAQLRRVHDLQRSLELEAEWLPARKCRDLEPGLTPSFHGGVFAAGEAAVDPRALTRALIAAARAEGVEVTTGTEVVEGIFEGDRLTGVRTRRGVFHERHRVVPLSGNTGQKNQAINSSPTADDSIRAETVVLANGAWSGATPWLPEHARPAVRPVKGQVLELRRRDGEPPAHHILASERVYLVPRGDGRLIVGATVEELGYDTTVTAGGVHELLREAYRLLPDVAEMELVDAIAGLRPGTPNNLPLVGPGAIDGLVLATGHFRNGILLAPLAAQAVADLLSSRRSSLSRYRPPKDERAVAEVGQTS
ncbi:MAG TPA: glycine oxidase ThiO [Solirubrobacterales bacterium]|nr:glycine oxidase ThiO [Solirubrobacterales bacterium]